MIWYTLHQPVAGPSLQHSVARGTAVPGHNESVILPKRDHSNWEPCQCHQEYKRVVEHRQEVGSALKNEISPSINSLPFFFRVLARNSHAYPHSQRLHSLKSHKADYG